MVVIAILIAGTAVAITGVVSAGGNGCGEGGGGNECSPTGAVFAVNSAGNDIDLHPTTEIYIYGHTLANNTQFSWKIYDMATGGQGTLVNSGSGGMINSDGKIIPYQNSGWSIPDGDYVGHPYRLKVKIGPLDEECDREFYTKVDSFEPIPEASTMVLASMGIFGILFISRKYGKK